MPHVSNININVHLNKKFEGTLSFPIQTFADRSSIANLEVDPVRVAINNHKFGTDNSKQAKKGSKKEDVKNSVALLPGSYCITQGGQLTSEAQPANSTKSNSEHQPDNGTRLTSKHKRHRNIDLIPAPSLSLNSSLNQNLSNLSTPKSRKEELKSHFKERSEELLKSNKAQARNLKISAPLTGTDRKSNLATRSFFGKDLTRKDFASSLGTGKNGKDLTRKDFGTSLNTAKANDAKLFDAITSTNRTLKKGNSVNNSAKESKNGDKIASNSKSSKKSSQRVEENPISLSSTPLLLAAKQTTADNVSLHKSGKDNALGAKFSETQLIGQVIEVQGPGSHLVKKGDKTYLHRKLVTLNAVVDNIPFTANVDLVVKSRNKNARIDIKQIWVDEKLFFGAQSEPKKPKE